MPGRETAIEDEKTPPNANPAARWAITGSCFQGVTRSPASPLVDVRAKPNFLPTVPDRNPRREWAC
jgi:hypothetical protein